MNKKHRADCLRCERHLFIRGRGLCSSCYERHADEFPLLVPSSAHRGNANGFIVSKLPQAPTDARAGSPEKIAVMAERAERGEQLHHPEDSTVRATAVPLRTRAISDRTVRTIRRMARNMGDHWGSRSEIAVIFGLSRQKVSDIINRRTYSHVPDEYTEAAAS